MGNLLILQGGGPTPVVNATLAGALREAYANGKQKIFGARHGMEGLIQGKVVDLSGLSSSQLGRLARTPGAALGSSRIKPSVQEQTSILNFLQKLTVSEVLFIGGNGTMRAAHCLSRFCHDQGYELSLVGIPKTVDNDIPGTDRCPGYASAARYVAQSTRDLGMDVRSLPQPVSIFETMGRSVGWLAAASAAAKRDRADAPHLIYLPEIPFDTDEFLADLDGVLRRQQWAIVVICEGIRNRAGRAVYETEAASQADALKRPLPGGVSRFLAQIVTRELKIRCRDEKPGLIGRASMIHVATQDLEDAEFVGAEGVRALRAGHRAIMIALKPLEKGSKPSSDLIGLESVACADRTIPQSWLCDDDVPVNSKFLEYVRPLIGDLLEYESCVSDRELYADA